MAFPSESTNISSLNHSEGESFDQDSTGGACGGQEWSLQSTAKDELCCQGSDDKRCEWYRKYAALCKIWHQESGRERHQKGAAEEGLWHQGKISKEQEWSRKSAAEVGPWRQRRASETQELSWKGVAEEGIWCQGITSKRPELPWKFAPEEGLWRQGNTSKKQKWPRKGAAEEGLWRQGNTSEKQEWSRKGTVGEAFWRQENASEKPEWPRKGAAEEGLWRQGSAIGRTEWPQRGAANEGLWRQGNTDKECKGQCSIDEEDSRNILMVNSRFDSSKEFLEKPLVLGRYFLNSRRASSYAPKLHFVSEEYLPKHGRMSLNINLSEGHEKYSGYLGCSEENFQNLLKWILNNKDRIFDGSSQRLTVDFVCARRCLTSILTTIYDEERSWTIYATEFKGTVYLQSWKGVEDEFPPEEELEANSNIMWCRLFQHHVCADNYDPEGVGLNEEHRLVLKSSIGGKSLMYAPVINCADQALYRVNSEDMDAFLSVQCIEELKNSAKIINFKKNRLRKLWIVNQLSGISRTLVGYRNDKGLVHTLELIETQRIPLLAEEWWKPNFSFMVKFLHFVNERMRTDPGATFVFKHFKEQVTCLKLSENTHFDLLPRWYKEGLVGEMCGED